MHCAIPLPSLVFVHLFLFWSVLSKQEGDMSECLVKSHMSEVTRKCIPAGYKYNQKHVNYEADKYCG